VSQGFVLWFTGLSGSGKSTLAAQVATELSRRGVHVERLDGDEVRKNLSKGLGFSREDRDTNIRRIGYVAKLVARSGGCAITAAISPYRAVRDEVRRSAERFCEVYVECPLEVLAERDPKGLYKKALAGEIKNFTGVSDPYEAPLSPEVHVRSDRETPEESVTKILARLEELGFIGAHAGELARPHGGDLMEAQVEAVDSALPSIELGPQAALELACLASGAYSPLAGFMNEKDYLRVARAGRLENGLLWPVPITLAVETPPPRGRAALRSADGTALGTLDVHDVYEVDGVTHVGGDVRVPDATNVRAVRDEMRARGWRRVVAWQPRTPPLLSDEHAARAALEFADGLLVQPRGELVAECCSVLCDRYFARERTLVAPLRSPHDSPLLDAIVARNHGASHLLTPDELDGALDELGLEAIPLRPMFLSQRVGVLASAHTAPETGTTRSYAEVRAALDRGESPPELRPEIAELLRGTSAGC
jgi:sulfate adenylyltransferase/3'-phosphoadenosine 5'-phosphosulfate synthase